MRTPEAATTTSGGAGPEPPAELTRAALAAPRQRRPALVVLGLLFVASAALAGAVLFGSLTTTMPVLAASVDLQPGQVISAGDLRVVELSEVGGAAVLGAEDQDRILGLAARGPVPAGTLLNSGLFVEAGAVVPAGSAVVGVSLDPGAAAGSGIRAGDRVDVLGVRSSGIDQTGSAEAEVLASGAVWAVEPPAPGSAGRIVVTLLVPLDRHAAVAQAAADDRLRLALVSR